MSGCFTISGDLGGSHTTTKREKRTKEEKYEDGFDETVRPILALKKLSTRSAFQCHFSRGALSHLCSLNIVCEIHSAVVYCHLRHFESSNLHRSEI